MKAYRFKAVYNDSPLFEFQVTESSNLDFLAQNLCESMQVEYDKSNTFMFTKKKGRNWDSNSKIHNDNFADELKSMQFRAGKKFFIVFDEDTAEGIEIHFLSKNNEFESEFEVVSKPKKLTAAQITKLSLKSLGKSKKKSKKSEKQMPVIEEPEEDDDDFIDDEMDDEEDSLNLTDADFERDYAEEDDDLDESGIFDAEEIESIDEDLDDALDIDDEEDYIDEEDEYYAEDDEDYIDKFENDEDEEEDDYYSDYDDDDDDDDDYYDDDDYDDDDDDRY